MFFFWGGGFRGSGMQVLGVQGCRVLGEAL